MVSSQLEDNDENDDENGDWKDANDPVHAFSTTLLVLLGLLNVSLCVLRVIQRFWSILVDLNEIGALFMHLSVDLLGNVVDIRHELLHVVQLLLPLLDHVSHVRSLTLHLQLLNIQLLLLQELLIVFVIVVQAARAIVIIERLSSLHQI